MNSSTTTWARVITNPCNNPRKVAIKCEYEQGQVLVQRAIQKRILCDQKRQKNEQVKVAILQIKQEQIKQEQIKTPIVELPKQKQPKQMTPSQMRKFAKKEVAKQKAKEDACWFEEITRIVELHLLTFQTPIIYRQFYK